MRTVLIESHGMECLSRRVSLALTYPKFPPADIKLVIAGWPLRPSGIEDAMHLADDVLADDLIAHDTS